MICIFIMYKFYFIILQLACFILDKKNKRNYYNVITRIAAKIIPLNMEEV